MYVILQSGVTNGKLGIIPNHSFLAGPYGPFQAAGETILRAEKRMIPSDVSPQPLRFNEPLPDRGKLLYSTYVLRTPCPGRHYSWQPLGDGIAPILFLLNWYSFLQLRTFPLQQDVHTHYILFIRVARCQLRRCTYSLQPPILLVYGVAGSILLHNYPANTRDCAVFR